MVDMAYAEIVEEAIRAGFLEVETSGGWVGLLAWTPYGKVEGHTVLFGIDGSTIRESLPPSTITWDLPVILGVWPIR